jgi:predicted dehydrogenase
VHGHVKGFLAAPPGNQAATLVAILELQEPLAKDYAAKYHLDAKLSYADLEKMLVEQYPDAVLAYTTIADHRKVIETAARHGVSSMVEKPLCHDSGGRPCDSTDSPWHRESQLPGDGSCPTIVSEQKRTGP